MPYVESFLQPASTELILFHLLEEPHAVHIHDSSVHIDIYVDEAIASKGIEIKRGLRRELNALAAAGFSTRVVVQFDDDVAQNIVEFAQNEAVDLIAMTTHGRTGLRRVITGSVAAHVLRHSGKPVLMLRPFGESAYMGLSHHERLEAV